jgi:hypothetical protein
MAAPAAGLNRDKALARLQELERRGEIRRVGRRWSTEASPSDVAAAIDRLEARTSTPGSSGNGRASADQPPTARRGLIATGLVVCPRPVGNAQRTSRLTPARQPLAVGLTVPRWCER